MPHSGDGEGSDHDLLRETVWLDGYTADDDGGAVHVDADHHQLGSGGTLPRGEEDL